MHRFADSASKTRILRGENRSGSRLLPALALITLCWSVLSNGAEGEPVRHAVVAPETRSATEGATNCCGDRPAPSQSSVTSPDCQFPPALCTGLSFEPKPKDNAGLKKDTWYLIGAQIASLGVLYVLPEAVSGWSEEQKDNYSGSKWLENAGNPVIDKDKFYINYILHPYWGAAYYVRAQERGYNRLESFWYSTLMSTLYEFGAEALFEEPSIQDLIVTPVFGALVGDYFMKLRGGIEDRSLMRGYRTWTETMMLVLTDPLGTMNSGIDSLIGRDGRASLHALVGSTTALVAGIGDGPHLLDATGALARPAGLMPFRHSTFANQLPALQGERIVGLRLSFSW